MQDLTDLSDIDGNSPQIGGNPVFDFNVGTAEYKLGCFPD